MAPALARAVAALGAPDLTLTGGPPGEPGGTGATGAPVRTAEHLPDVILLQDPALAQALANARLAPLDALPAGERDRLIQTLSAWLEHQRHTPRIAQALHVHPQTVRYRLARLRELLGDVIDDPDGRFELQLALRISGWPARRAGHR